MSTSQNGRLLKLTTPLKEDFLLIKRVRAYETISELFRFELEILHEEDDETSPPTIVDPEDVLGQPMTVVVDQVDGAQRYFNGICVDFTQGNRNNRFTKYRAEIVPKVWILTQNSKSRIFQNKSVKEIINKIFDGFEIQDETQTQYEPRNYCVQYRESDFDFASRLMEEEGIYYYFEHTADSHRMIIADTDGSHRKLITKYEIPFGSDISAERNEWSGTVLTWQAANKLRTGKYTLRDYNFQLPTNTLGTDHLSKFNIGGNQNFEFYDYPGDYAKRFDGIDSGGGEQASVLQKVFDDRTRTVGLRQQELDVAYKSNHGTSNCCAMTAGYRFHLTTHPTAANNINHILVSLRIDADQSPSYISEDEVSNPFSVGFTSIPQGEGHAPFRPLRKTEQPIIYGSQTATVVGPAGEEIFTDKYGRVKVQFHWDREGQADASSSCWLRVVQSWAGKKWGTMFIPRIGMEVLVDFLEGDPDQPIITGCVYNPDTMPPYTLPDEKTKSTIKTNSSPGGSGFNELRFEDKKGSEQIFIHAEKDQDIRVKNDCKEIIQHDRHLIINNDQYEHVDGDKHLHVKHDQDEQIDGSISIKANSNIQEKAGEKFAVDAGTEIHLKAGMKVVIEGGMQVTMKAGGNFVDISPAGVTIQGTMVLINSGGAAGSGSGSSPDAPKEAKEADKADSGEAAKARAAETPPPPAAPANFKKLQSAAQQSSPAEPDTIDAAIKQAMNPKLAAPLQKSVAEAVEEAKQAIAKYTDPELPGGPLDKAKNAVGPLVAAAQSKMEQAQKLANSAEGEAKAAADRAKAAAQEAKAKVDEAQAKVDQIKAEAEEAKAKLDDAKQTVAAYEDAVKGVGEQSMSMLKGTEKGLPFA